MIVMLRTKYHGVVSRAYVPGTSNAQVPISRERIASPCWTTPLRRVKEKSGRYDYLTL